MSNRRSFIQAAVAVPVIAAGAVLAAKAKPKPKRRPLAIEANPNRKQSDIEKAREENVRQMAEDWEFAMLYGSGKSQYAAEKYFR
ncbi:MAG: hypothetical protein ACYTEQ_28665, partial [Planctomycetota bacterium]